MTVYLKKSELNWKPPKLYRIVYAETVDDVQASYQYSLKDYHVDTWLRENCKYPYYHSPGYLKIKFIEFESSTEAVLFALKFL